MARKRRPVVKTTSLTVPKVSPSYCQNFSIPKEMTYLKNISYNKFNTSIYKAVPWKIWEMEFLSP